MRTVALIAAKDMRQELGNGTFLVFAIVLPLGLAFLFNTVFGSVEQLEASYGVVDQDGGEQARVFTDEVLGAVAEATGFEVRTADSLESATGLTEQGDLDATFVIPDGFSADVTAGRGATVSVIGHVDSPISTEIAAEIARAYAAELNRVQLAVAVAAAGEIPPGDLDDVAARVATVPPALSVVDDPTSVRRQLDAATYSAAGMAVFFLLFTAGLSITSLLREREEGTMARLLASPTSRGQILLGKLLATVLVSLVAMAVLVSASTLLLGASWGHPLGVAALVSATVLAATGLMTLVATFARTPDQAGNAASTIAVVLGLFGGSFVPLSQLGPLSAAAYATPHRWFLQGLSDLAGGDLSVVFVPVAVLLGFAAVTFALGLVRVKGVIRL